MYKSANVYTWDFWNHAYNFWPLFLFRFFHLHRITQIIYSNLCSAKTMSTIFFFLFITHQIQWAKKKHPITFIAAYLFSSASVFTVRVKLTSTHKFCVLYSFYFAINLFGRFNRLLHSFWFVFNITTNL